MRHTELWARMERHFGRAYSRVWADQFVMRELDQRTANEALAEGVQPKEVWEAVWRTLELPASEK